LQKFDTSHFQKDILFTTLYKVFWWLNSKNETTKKYVSSEKDPKTRMTATRKMRIWPKIMKKLWKNHNENFPKYKLYLKIDKEPKIRMEQPNETRPGSLKNNWSQVKLKKITYKSESYMRITKLFERRQTKTCFRQKSLFRRGWYSISWLQKNSWNS
jgi:hypothetical protein